MSPCGDRQCRNPHPSTWLEYGPLMAHPLPERDDPWNEPLPFDWRELLDPWLWVGAVMTLVGLVAGIWLIAAFVPGP